MIQLANGKALLVPRVVEPAAHRVLAGDIFNINRGRGGTMGTMLEGGAGSFCIRSTQWTVFHTMVK